MQDRATDEYPRINSIIFFSSDLVSVVHIVYLLSLSHSCAGVLLCKANTVSNICICTLTGILCVVAVVAATNTYPEIKGLIRSVAVQSVQLCPLLLWSVFVVDGMSRFLRLSFGDASYLFQFH